LPDISAESFVEWIVQTLHFTSPEPVYAMSEAGKAAQALGKTRFLSETWPVYLLRIMKFPFSTPAFARTLACVGILLCLFSPVSAFAGAVYKCTGPNGQIAFTNKIGTFKNCQQVSAYSEQQAPVVTAPSNGVGHTDYRSQPGESAAAVSTSSDVQKPVPNAEVHSGAVYKVAKANGITEYTNVRPAGGAAYRVLFTYMATCFACNVHSTVNWGNTPLNVDAFRDEIVSAANQYGVDAALLRAVIHAESAFNPNAVSIKGAQGLMQLMPDTATDLGVNNPFDAGQNIRGGAQYLSQLLKQFNGDERLAAAAYDAGAQNVQKYNGVPPFDETQVYVERVATLRKRYGGSTPAPVVAAAPPRS
jgi:hypothetical protein